MNACERDARCLTPEIGHVASEAFDLIKRWASESVGGRWDGRRIMPTGFLNIDEHIWGLRPGELTVITGAPGVGKSSFALNLASRAVVTGFDVLLVSLEASAAMTFIRLCAIDARFDIGMIIRGRIPENGWAAIVEASDRLGKPNLRIIDDPHLTREELREEARKLAEESDGALVVVDGIELASDFGAAGEPSPIRERAIELKRLARETGVHIAVTMDYGPGSRHKVSDCEGVLKALPNGVEGVADTIMHIGRNLTLRQPPKAASQRIAEVIIAKSRSCAPARTKLAFLSECLRFMDYVDL